MVRLLVIGGSTTILTFPSDFSEKMKSYHRQVSVIALCMPDEMVRGMMDGDMFLNSITGVITQRLL